jgi:hypothetical protein
MQGSARVTVYLKKIITTTTIHIMVRNIRNRTIANQKVI